MLSMSFFGTHKVLQHLDVNLGKKFKKLGQNKVGIFNSGKIKFFSVHRIRG